jgi:hypothetical protein
MTFMEINVYLCEAINCASHWAKSPFCLHAIAEAIQMWLENKWQQ